MKYTIDDIREHLSDTAIVNALIQYMSSDQLNDFVEELVKDNDLEEYVTNCSDWFESLVSTEKEKVKDIVMSNCWYCTEPHQLNIEDTRDCIDYEHIKKDIEHNFEIDIEDDDFENFCYNIIVDSFNEDSSQFLI